jgi:hypothetical protein
MPPRLRANHATVAPEIRNLRTLCGNMPAAADASGPNGGKQSVAVIQSADLNDSSCPTAVFGSSRAQKAPTAFVRSNPGKST